MLYTMVLLYVILHLFSRRTITDNQLKSIVLIGIISEDGSLPRLEEEQWVIATSFKRYIESKSIGAFFPEKLENFDLSNLSKKKLKIIHLAGHPSNLSILFKGKHLHGVEALKKIRDTWNPYLIFLNGCYSEKMLKPVFQNTGTFCVVTNSLVEDGYASAFATIFYRAFFEKNANTQDAFEEAKKLAYSNLARRGVNYGYKERHLSGFDPKGASINRYTFLVGDENTESKIRFHLSKRIFVIPFEIYLYIAIVSLLSEVLNLLF